MSTVALRPEFTVSIRPLRVVPRFTRRLDVPNDEGSLPDRPFSNSLGPYLVSSARGQFDLVHCGAGAGSRPQISNPAAL